jgi:glycine/D-amino acid oxidase-like deaminating enzyme
VTSQLRVDGIVLGAGIAGLSAADALIQKGRSCVIFDPAPPGSGSSSAPGMLINPATGRRAKMTWRAEACYQETLSLLQRVQKETEEVFYEERGVLRPALTPKLAKNFERSPEKYPWPKGWIEWLSKENFSDRFPEFKTHQGGLIVKKGMTVRGDHFIKAFARYLEKKGADLVVGQYSLENAGKIWIAETVKGKRYNADFVIDATSQYQIESGLWNFLPLHAVKGQTATFQYDHKLPLNASVSSLGYMAYFSTKPKQVTVGSTYEHHFTSLEPDEEGLEYLKEKLGSTFPTLRESYKDVVQWSGVRVTVPDKKPLIGSHPGKEGLHMIGALGSKGLLMGRYLAGLLADQILDRKEIDEFVSIRRYVDN